MLQYTTRLLTTGADAYGSSPTVCFDKPKDSGSLDVLVAQSREKCGGYLTLRLSLPHRPRSTGWKSQNAHLHGHIRQLCEPTGYTMSEMKQIIKEDTPSWPVEYKEFRGKRRAVYASEADISMEVASEAIEICHVVAADLGVRLQEGEE
jgi:hypothetical protein